MDWDRLAQAVIDRRAALGYRTREALAGAAGLSSRLLGDLEHNRRQNYDRITLARVEGALEWDPGTINTILRGGPYPGMPKPDVPNMEAELMTPTGLLANLHANRIDYVALIHESGLGPDDRFALVKQIRLAQDVFDRQLFADIADEIRRRGGTVNGDQAG